MSRIGRQSIAVPSGVTVTIVPGKVSVKGPKGSLETVTRQEVKVEVKGNQISVANLHDSRNRHARAYHGMTRALLQSMVKGVATGYEKALEIIGVGYNAKVQGKDVILALGYSHPLKITIPSGITVECPQPTQIQIKGCDKQAVGQLAAQIRKLRPPEPYKGKGVKYTTETIKRKAGKAFGSA